MATLHILIKIENYELDICLTVYYKQNIDAVDNSLTHQT